MSDETDPTTETDVPSGIAAAWGVRERPGKGPRPGLSVRRIVQAAIRTALDEGLGAVSMNRVASQLGTAAMSLYRYVSAKDELIALMVDEANGPPPDPPDAGVGWRAALAHWAKASLAVYRRHPWLVHVPLSGPPIMPNAVAWFEQWLRSLAGTPLTEEEKVSVVLLVSGLVRNHATLEAQITAALQSADSQQVMHGYGAMLARLTDEERFPALHAAIAAGVFDGGGDGDAADDLDVDFGFGLERVLDGIEAYISGRPMIGAPVGQDPGIRRTR